MRHSKQLQAPQTRTTRLEGFDIEVDDMLTAVAPDRLPPLLWIDKSFVAGLFEPIDQLHD
ncbi:hypothetical protein NC77_21990 [Janthinobacterium lividum]|nr:hypothetical protein NC77_21990 [Janthinobacterium lividum]